MDVITHVKLFGTDEPAFSFVPATAMNGFLRKDSLVGSIMDMQLPLGEHDLAKIDAELHPIWCQAIETLLCHKHIQPYHHLVWRSRIAPQIIGGRRLAKLLRYCSIGFPPLHEKSMYVVYTAESARNATPIPFSLTPAYKTLFQVTNAMGRLSDYYYHGL